MKMALPRAQTLPIDEVTPYWRNPRRIPNEAVIKVAASIKEYGYHQPIVVDSNLVIIVGHTRYEALKSLGYGQALVYISDLPEEKAREYRLVDNRTAQMSSWDHEALVTELREFEQSLLDDFFPNVDLEIGKVDSEPEVTESDIRQATEKITRVTEADPKARHTTEVVCPSCFHSFAVRTRSLPGLTREDLEALAYGEAD